MHNRQKGPLSVAGPPRQRRIGHTATNNCAFRIGFFQKRSWTIWGAQTTEMSPLGAPFELFFGPSDVPKSLENGSFCEKKRIKNGCKMFFPKNDFGQFGVFKRANSAHFGPI